MVKSVEIKSGPLVKNVIVFALPLVLSGIFQLLFNAVDIMAVGRLMGSRYLAAIGATAPIIAFFANSLFAFAQGISVLISRRTEGADGWSVGEITSIVLVLSLGMGILIGSLCIATTPWMLGILSTPEDIIDLSVQYLRIYMAGMPFFLFYNFGSAVIRSMGNTVVSLAYVAASGLCNVVLNIAFIKLGMGVVGVAIATVISQIISAVLVAVYIHKSGWRCPVVWDKALAVSKEIFRLGIPAGLQTILLSLSNIIIQEEVNKFGTVVLAGQTVYMSLNGFLLAAINAATQTAIVFVGHNDAERDRKRVIYATACCSLLSLVFGSGLGLTVFLLGDIVCLPYTDSQEVIDVVKTLLPICAIPYGICGIMEALAGSVRGLGRSLSPTVMYLLGVGVFRVLWIKLALPQHYSLEGLFACYPVSWVITSILQLTLFYVVMKKKYKI